MEFRDPASIETAVGTPLDEIDADVNAILTDPRWADRRTPVDASVVEASLADGAVTSRKILPTIVGAASNSTIFAGNTLTDVPGTSVTFSLPVRSVLLLSMVFEFAIIAAPLQMGGYAYVDGVLQRSKPARFELNAQGRCTAAQQSELTLASGSHTIRLVATANVINAGQVIEVTTAWRALVVAA
ncbi:hypothetical protein [Conexibacter sp. CPCC 206217]|uniref:hypothetical protein n=1 Tax=Conexibacter sp. CPCC 206217 TaxID=3064574 RepID=UPI0027239F67|nr:hypothetical protein [Conexibacter sp. CPCC 206217]MDO8208946.1 hypothetical protein [Conexibacter sp. CPCC 206217]